MRFKWLCPTLLVVFSLPASFAGTLRVGVPQVNGDQVVLPVVLDGDSTSGVAALDFTLNYDPAVFAPVKAEASDAAEAARKQIESNESSPGNYVVMMFGMNQTTVGNGEVASITLTRKTQPDSNQSEVSIANTTFASVEGLEIDSQGSTQTVTFPPPADDDDETPPPTNETPRPPPRDDDDGIPTPVPPVDTPTAPAPVTPGTPGGGGTPQKPGPTTESPRGAPMVASSSALDATNNRDRERPGMTEGVARMNRATQQLENSRAALGSSGQIGQVAASDNDANNTPRNETAKSTPSTSPSAPSPSQEPEVKVAAVSASPEGISATNTIAATTPRSDPADGSGIPASSRRLLMIVGSVIAICLVAYRYVLKSRSSARD